MDTVKADINPIGYISKQIIDLLHLDIAPNTPVYIVNYHFLCSENAFSI